MQKKLLWLYALIIIAFAGLSIRLFWIVKEDGTKYQKQVLAQQRYDSTTLPFRRGDIVDAKGTKLAVSEKVYNLIVDANVMLAREEYLEPTLQALGENFPELNMSEIREYVVSHPNSSWYVPLKQLSYEEISGFQRAQLEDNNIKGIFFEAEYKRVYPNSSLAADVIGFVRSDNQGMYGLEEYYNDVLNGTPGREYGYLNDDAALERTVKPAVDGNSIHSTIDANVQSIIEKHLLKFNEQYKDNAHPGNGAENVGCIIMEVDTGNVLGMASYPYYNLNDTRNTDALLGSRMVEMITNANGYQVIQKTDTYITQETIDAMDEDALYLNLNNLWKNYCIVNTYEPGSTAKPFTVAAALETGAITGNEHYSCTGSLEVGGHTIGCHSISYGGDGDVSVQAAVAQSCNVALMRIAQAMGKDAFAESQEVFNFGLKTNIDLAGEARTDTLLFPVDRMGAADLATNSFGQNFNATMIQMITGFCSLINGGYYYEPHMVDKITNANGAIVENIEPRVLKQTVSESTSALIRQYCNAVVTEGTGKTARPAGYMIGGKTGTAETLPRDNGEYIVSFMGYAPADDPEIAIYVVVDRPNVAKQDDAKFATRIVRSILTEVLPYMNIYMTEELSEKEIQELNELQLEITTQYTQKPEEDALENLEGEGTEGGETQEGEEGYQAPYKSFPIDPATGNFVNPTTGDLIDPDTGAVIGKCISNLSDAPTNNNILDSQKPVEEE
ncbi:MAG: penicillin-binding protein 2 [Lachnospiraceae bacterium]|nr:penicillin-binding protein 2 [Lachnospiraceae bacterium]